MLQPRIGDPLELGTVHVITTFDPEVETVGASGQDGLRAVTTRISELKGPSPKTFTAVTLNRQVFPGVRPEMVSPV